MNTPSTPQDHDDFMGENMQKRLKNMFSEQEPPAFASLREMEAMQKRIRELEAQLEQSSPEPQATTPSITQPLGVKEAPVDQTQQISPYLFRVSLFMLGAAVFSLPLYVFLAARLHVWQLNVLIAVSLVFAISSAWSAWLARRGQVALSGSVLMGGLSLIVLAVPLLIAGLGLFLGLAFPLAILIAASPTLTGRPATRAILVAALVGVTSIVLSSFWQSNQISIPELQVAIPGVAIVNSILMGFMVVRQFPSYSLRIKLVVVLVGVTLVSISAVAFTINSLVGGLIRQGVGNNLSALAQSKALEIGTNITHDKGVLETLTLNQLLKWQVDTVNASRTSKELKRLDQQWRAAPDNDPLIQDVLNNQIAEELHKFQKRFPQFVEIFITDSYGANIAATNRTSDYYQADEEWWQAAWNDGKGGTYFSQPTFDESAGIYAIDIAVPFFNDRSNLIGILRATVDVTPITTILQAGEFAQTGKFELVLPDNQALTSTAGTPLHQLDSISAARLASLHSSFDQFNYEGSPSLVSKRLISTNVLRDQQTIEKLGWYVVVHQDESEALLPVTVATRTTLTISLFLLLLTSALAIYMGRLLTTPLTQLTSVVEQVSQGDLTAQANIRSRDEIGTLASTFNSMTTQLRSLLTSMEQRVAERTHDLELASAVGRAVSEKVGNLNVMLLEATETIRSNFNLYYTQVYLVDSSGRSLVLRAGTGEVGSQLLRRGHRLPMSSTSLNGQAASERQAVYVSDTQKSPNFLPNPLLPLTRSELSVPLIANDRVVGVLDMQSQRAETFGETNLPAFQVLAGQLAIAVQNSLLFDEIQEARLAVEDQARLVTRSRWDEFLNAIDSRETIGYVFNQDEVLPLVETQVPLFDNTLVAPIQIAGATVGVAQLADEADRKWTDTETDIVQATMFRVGQHIESLRLLAQSERYRAQSEQVSRRLTREGWASYLSTRKPLENGYVYDLSVVESLPAHANDNYVSNLVQPVVVHDEIIGELAVAHTDESSMEATELFTAVAHQLGDHIENLRLLEQAQERTFELEEAQGFLDSVIENLPNMLFVKSAEELRFVRWNKTAEQLVGYSQEEMLGKNDYDFFPKDEADLFTDNDRQVLVSGQMLDIPQEPLQTAHQGLRYMHTRKVPIYGADGKTHYLLGIAEDITERKQAEETLRISEARLSEALNIAKLANWEYDLEKEKFIFNDHFYSIFHTTAEQVGGYELSGEEYSKLFVHPEDAYLVGQEIARGLNSTEPHFSAKLEHRMYYADGGMGYITVEVHIERDENGKIVRWYGANQDITERKKAELAIQESEARLSEALNIAKLANWEYDVEKDIFTFNDHFYSIFHTTADQVGGYQLSSADYARLFVHPDDMPVVGAEIGKALASTDRHYSTKLEHRILFGDGGMGYISVDIQIDRDEDGIITRYYGANQDITERKKAELAIQESEAQLSEALAIAKLAHWEYDVEKDIFTFNDHFYSIFHTTADQVGGYQLSSADYARLFVHPDDMPVVGAEIGKALASTDRHYSTKLEHRILFVDGGMGYISVDIHIDRDENGTITRYYGANQDITERKKAEEVIRLAQQRAQIILESITLPMVITRLSDNHLTFVNPPALEVTHFDYEEVINQPSPNFYYNSEDRKQFVTELRATGLVSNMVVQLRRKSGEPFWALLSARIFDYQGETSILTTFMDITDRIHAQEAVAKRAAELQTVAEVSTTTATTLDPDRLLQAVVDLTKEQFGLYHAHIYLADESWNMLLLAAGAGEVGRKLVAQEHAIPINLEQSLVARAAREQKAIIVNEVSTEPGFLPNPWLPETRAEMAVPMIVGSQVLGVFDVQSNHIDGFSDEDANIYVTLAAQVGVALQNARLYVEQAAAVTQLRELDRLKSSFLANMSHELRTPLNSILGFTDVMLEGLDGNLTDYMDNDLRLIQKNGQHLLHLINDVLDMAKIESGRMNLHPENFKIHSVLEEVTSITSTLASEKNLSLFIEEGSDQELEIYADNTRLRQVMINLVNNSIKFTEKGRISICAKPIEGARVLITVKDTGIGIPVDQLEAVFQEFTQVDTSSTRKVGGTGLGLPISRRLVEMHGGRLWAESTGIEGEGSTFYVEMPVEARISEVIEKQEK